MSDAVTIITLDQAIDDKLEPVKAMSFRDLVGHGVFLKDAFSFLSRSPEEMGIDVAGYPDAITYCFIDEEVGVCFRCLAAARETEGGLEILEAFSDVALTIRRARVRDALCAVLPDEAPEAYAAIMDEIEEAHRADEFTEGMRELANLDGLRDSDMPDFIKAVLMGENPDDGYELVLVKPWATSDDIPQCVLMSEPANEALGAHAGDVFGLSFQKSPDGLIAIAHAPEVEA